MGTQSDGKKVAEVLIRECDILYKGENLSSDRLLKEYIKFLADGFFSCDRKVLFSLHTGSVCFDVLSILVAALRCVFSEINEGICEHEFKEGDIVVYHNKRYRWRGLLTDPFDEGKNVSYYCIAQDAKGKDGESRIYIHPDCMNQVKPYFGTSVRTDGMGLRKKGSGRENFLSGLFEIPQEDIPPVINSSFIVVCRREYASDLIKNTIIWFRGQSIELSDVAPASYFACEGEDYQIGENRLKAEPVIRVAGDLSCARDLILDKSINTCGFEVIDAGPKTTRNTELEDLLSRKSVNCIHLSGVLDPVLGQYALDKVGEKSVFACTSDFLKQFMDEKRESLNNKNDSLKDELHEQTENIIYNYMTYCAVEGGWQWKEYRDLRKDLKNLQASSWEEGKKNKFVLIAYSLINLLNTALFSMEHMENAINEKRINTGVESPSTRIDELMELSEESGAYCDTCLRITVAIDEQYRKQYSRNPKFDATRKYINDYFTRNSTIALVVPKAYYVTLLSSYMRLSDYSNIDVVTPSCFDKKKYYDGVLVTGNIKSKIFDPLNCKTAREVVSFVYGNEQKIFQYKKHQIEDLDRRINLETGVLKDYGGDVNDFTDHDEPEENIADDIGMIEESDDIIENLSLFNLPGIRVSGGDSDNDKTSAEIVVTGTFVTGESILFTKYYKAVVYEPSQGMITEKTPESIMPGDILIFMSRDSYTKNTVDTIYDHLLSSGRFDKAVVNASEMANYWKKALLEYKEKNQLTYRELAKRLNRSGSIIQEQGVRQWLAEDSHIVGPREEATMLQIAKLTDDPYLKADSSAYFEACRVVRKQRRRILKLIGIAITEKMRGTVPKDTGIVREIFDNVDKLSSSLEIDSVSVLKEPVEVMIGYANKPVDEREIL